MMNVSSLLAQRGALANSPLDNFQAGNFQAEKFQAELAQLAKAGTAAQSGSTSTTLSGMADVEKVGNEFEAVFLSLMLKEMRNTLDTENGGLFAGEGSDTLGGMFDMFMSQHMAKSQPLGIGDAIRGYMSNQPDGDAG